MSEAVIEKVKPILTIEDVSIKFGDFKAIKHVSTSVKEKEIRFFIGPNGAGKTTILDAICGKNKISEDLNKKVENENEGEELDNILVLNDEEGNEVEFEFLDLIEYEGEEYVVLLPVDEEETEEPGEVVILKLEDTESEEEESYVSVEDENVLNKVFEKFTEKFEDEFNFVD